MTPHWSSPFIGLPFAEGGRSRDGVDCYGLARLVYAAAGVQLDAYAGAYASVRERQEIAALIQHGRLTRPWYEVARESVQPRDLIVFRRAGADAHIGVVVTRGMMLHVSADHESRIERYGAGAWLPRLVGCYRHEALA